MVWSLWKTVRWFSKRLKIEVSYNPVFLLLGIYLKELKAETQTETCTAMFVAAFFIRVKGESNLAT